MILITIFVSMITIMINVALFVSITIGMISMMIITTILSAERMGVVAVKGSVIVFQSTGSW